MNKQIDWLDAYMGVRGGIEKGDSLIADQIHDTVKQLMVDAADLALAIDLRGGSTAPEWHKEADY